MNTQNKQNLIEAIALVSAIVILMMVMGWLEVQTWL